MENVKILIVEDEIKVAGFLKKGLEEIGYDTEIAFDGIMGLKLFQQSNFQIIILDINLPLLNGFELCKEIRMADSRIPIIMLTALSGTDNKIMGFDSGADDYLVKPFEFRELIARIKVLLKRFDINYISNPILKIADLEMNTDTKIVKRGEDIINLTAKEFALLEYLLKNQNRVVSRVDIAEKIWDINFDTGTNVIDVYINKLRSKIDKNHDVKLIQTVRGVGYVLKV